MKKLIEKIFSYQGIRFLFVGGLNTIVGYGIYALLVYLNVNYLIANTISTIIGVAHSYFWNRYFTFKSKQKALKEITKFVSVYVVSYLIGMCTLFIFKDKLNISPYFAGLINLIITTLISYFGHKYISFRSGEDKMKDKLNIIKDKLLKIDNGPTKLEWVLLIIILVFCYFSFNHGDITATSTHGKDLLECIFQGKFFEFYDYTQSTAVYLIPIYIIFAIWSLPVVLIYSLFNIPLWGVIEYREVNFYTLMWYKLLPTLFTIATAKLLVKILKEIGLSEIKQKWVPFVFLSFPPLVFSQFIFGQYDSICMFFTTLSLYYFIKKKYLKFTIIMSIAITFKLFPLFIFIPLLLLHEKRLYKLFQYFAIGIFPTAICNIMFINSPGFMEAKEFTAGMIGRFFMSGIPTYSGLLSAFVLIFMGVCVYAYNKKIDEDNKIEYLTNTLYLSLVSYSAFFMFCLWHPQWILLLVPFLILTLFLTDNPKTTLILYFIISFGYLFVSCHHFPGNVDEAMIDRGMFVEIFDKIIPKNGEIDKFLNLLFGNNLGAICTALFTGTLIIILIMKFKLISNPNKIEEVIKEKTFNFERGYLLMQILPIFFFIFCSLYLFFIYYK